MYRRGHFRSLPSRTIRVRSSGTRRAYSYTRKAKRVYVEPTKIANLGLPGRGKQLIGKLRKGMLTMYGYRPKFSLDIRRQALMRALRKTPLGTLVKRLTAVSTLTKRTIPKVSRIYMRNRNWVKKQYKQ